MQVRRIVERLVERYGYRTIMGLVSIIGQGMIENEETEEEMKYRLCKEYVLRIVKRKSVIMRSDLLRRIVGRGIHADLLTRIMDDLQEAGLVQTYRDRPIDRQGKIPFLYKYIGEDNG